MLAAAVTLGGQVTGVDPSGPAISYATRRGPGDSAFAVGVAQDLGGPDHSFDVVTCTLAVHHIPEAVRDGAFREIYRVTRPGGHLLKTDFRPSRLASTAPTACATPTPPRSTAWPKQAGFRVETTGDLPLLRYVQAVRPESCHDARCHNDGMSWRIMRTVMIIVGVVAGATLIGRRLGYNLGTSTIVRCRQGHLFTTIWIPGVKLKELDLVVARVQRCPVGKHWSLVVPGQGSGPDRGGTPVRPGTPRHPHSLTQAPRRPSRDRVH